MRLSVAVLIVLAVALVPLTAMSAKENGPNPNERAMERANDNASFKRGDSKSDKHEMKEDKKSGKKHKNAKMKDKDKGDKEEKKPELLRQ
jgi:hypothetical protein